MESALLDSGLDLDVDHLAAICGEHDTVLVSAATHAICFLNNELTLVVVLAWDLLAVDIVSNELISLRLAGLGVFELSSLCKSGLESFREVSLTSVVQKITLIVTALSRTRVALGNIDHEPAIGIEVTFHLFTLNVVAVELVWLLLEIFLLLDETSLLLALLHFKVAESVAILGQQIAF